MWPCSFYAILLITWTLTSDGSAVEPKKREPIAQDSVAAYEKLGAVHGGFQFDERGKPFFTSGSAAAKKGLPGFWFRKLPDGKIPSLPRVQVAFGLQFGGQQITDDGLKELRNLETLEALLLGLSPASELGREEWRATIGTSVTNRGLKELRDLKNLTTLDLNLSSEIGDEGIQELKNLNKITSLQLFATNVTDKGLKAIKEFKELTSLDLGSTHVTDSGVSDLKSLNKLVYLDLRSTSVSEKGLKSLKTALPKCTILDGTIFDIIIKP